MNGSPNGEVTVALFNEETKCNARRLKRFSWLAYQIVLAIVLMGQADAAGAFDGSYTGHLRLVSINYRSCSVLDRDEDGFTLIIENNHFVTQWENATYSVDVEPDGSFDAILGAERGRVAVREIKGMITGPNLEADMGNSYCGSHLSLIRR